MNNTSTTTTSSGNPPMAYTGYNNSGKKFKPYRNRPSIRQTILEILSFLLILAAAPAFLGGTISIFVCYFTLIMGLIGLFAWTRRHAALFALLALCVIALCIVNIILRSGFHGDNRGQCLPYFYYSNQFNNEGLFRNGGAADVTGTSEEGKVNSTTFPFIPQVNKTETGSTVIAGAQAANHGNNNQFNNSIWCGNKYIVYITHGIILLLAIPAFLIALSLLCKKRRANNNVMNTGYKHTETTTTQRVVATA